MDIKKTGILLRSLRVSKGLTQQQVADQLLVSPKTISKWENGEGLPDITIMTAVADLYGITVDDLLRGKLIDVPNTQERSKSLDRAITYKVYQKMILTFIVAFSILVFGLLIGLIFEFSVNPILGVMIRSLFLLSSLVAYVIGYRQYLIGKIISDDERILNAYDHNQPKVRWLHYYLVIILFIYYYAGITWSLANIIDNAFLQVNTFTPEALLLVGLLIYAAFIMKNNRYDKNHWLMFDRFVFLTLIVLVITAGFYSNYGITTIHSETWQSTRSYTSVVNLMLFNKHTSYYVFRSLSLGFIGLMTAFTIITRKSKRYDWVYIIGLILSILLGYLVHHDLKLTTSLIIVDIMPFMTLHLPGYILIFILFYINHLKRKKSL